MHLAQRAYLFIALIGVLAIAGIWSDEPALHGLWRYPALLLLIGIALESWFVKSTALIADVEIQPRSFLGRSQPAAFTFRNDTHRDVKLEYAPVTPSAFEAFPETRKITALLQSVTRDEFTLHPNRLGSHAWPGIPMRLLGRYGLVWWSRQQSVQRKITVAPDTLRTPRVRPTGVPTGMRPRKVAGAGSELHQLRSYAPGDPPARIDWKATARLGRLITREFSEDQHLDILIAIDAGRLSRIRAGRLDRLGLYANIAARFAEAATPENDRVGLIVFSDRTLAVCAPDRGLAAVSRIRQALERLSAQSAESDPLAAAIRMRALLTRRSLIVMLTDPEDPALAEPLARAVRLLSPPHFVVVAGVHSPEIADLAQSPARGWRDPWIALAAQEREAAATHQRDRLKRLGAPVVAAREELLEGAVFAEYRALRRSRRI